MYKVSIELFKVHKSCKVKFGLVVRDDVPNNYSQMISKFSFGGNDYMNITPHPFVTIDIRSKMDKKDEWNTNMFFNMNRRELYIMVLRLTRLYNSFVNEKELFFYDENNILKVHPEKADKHKEIVVCGNKTIWIQACVVESEEDKQLYEGVFMSINSVDFFTYLTYSELGYLIYELRHINMSALTMEVINTVYLTEEIEKKELKKKPAMIEQKEEEIVDTKTRVRIEEPNTIPEI